MNKVGSYENELSTMSPKKWEGYLKAHSGLPGPHGNIELARAFAETASMVDFKKYIYWDAEVAPENTPECFLAFCGILGVGKYLAKEHDERLIKLLRQKANDSRWRIREAVAMALQMVGERKMSRLIAYAQWWSKGTFLEQRAAIAALCEPKLLANSYDCIEVLDILDWVTAEVVQHDEQQKSEEYRVLQKGLSYCWSVAVVALPEKGKKYMERWVKERHPVVSAIMKKNLEKKRLQNMDAAWVSNCRQKLFNS